VGIFITPNQIVESNPGGTVLTDLDVYKKKQKQGKLEYDIFTFKQPLNDLEKFYVMNFVVDQIGTKYDFLQLISLFFFFVFHINRETIDPIDCRRAFICSELIAEAYGRIGRIFNPEVDIDNTTPADIVYSDIIYKV
jgi:hypothetical protein